MYKSLENSGFEEISIEKDNNRTRAVRTCTKRREIKFLSQTLKNHSEELVIKLKIAKGEISIKIWTIIYLSELLNIKFIKPIEVNDLTIPSKENRLKSPDKESVLFISLINSEKLKSELKRL